MSLVLADRVRETTQTTGTGTITLDGAVQGFQSFSVIGNNNTTYYTINRGAEWEVGIGTYYGGTLSRDTVYASSNSGNKVNFSAGSKDVFVTYPAEKSVNQDANNRVLIPYTSGTTNVGSLNVGNATAHTDSGVIAGFTASEPLYLYTSLQNTSASNTSYASYAVNDGGHTAYGELGINNANYSYSAAGFPNNGFSTPLASFVESFGGPLVLGSWDSQKISFIVNGAVNTADAMTIETTGAVTIPTAAVTGGTINGATVGATTPAAGTFTTVSFPAQSSAPATPSTGFTQYASSTGMLSWKGTNGFIRQFNASGITADRTWVLPNAAGTIALTSDLGTIASQNANAVTITGGTIDGTTVGATTASTGRFTTVTSTVATGTAPFTVASTTAVANLSIGGNAGTVTNGVYTTDTGTVTNTMLAGSIANAKLTNSSITFGSTAQALGSTVSAISGVTIDNGAIGGTTPAAGTFTTLIGGGGSANYGQLTGGATTKAVEFKTLGNDTNVSYAIQSKGTGAIDLAAGSSGVNISNGGTVTAITRTAGGSSYTSFPSVAITAPTTAGGVQATATCTVMFSAAATIANGGTGYTVGDTLTMVGGTPTSTGGTFTVSTVSSGVVTAVTAGSKAYTALPTNPVSTTGGTGTGCTLNVTYSVDPSGITIGTAGSGYVEQPTVTFSGGGGSGAAAYATVGSGTKVQTLGSTLDFYTPSQQIAFRVQDNATTSTGYWTALGGTTTPILRAVGIGAGRFDTASAVPFSFLTNSASSSAEQFRIAHTASAVNYVQVTGGVTGNPATVTASAQGSDSNVNMRLTPKGTGTLLTATAATILDGTAIPAGGTAGAGYKLSSTANFGIFFGSGAPTLAAAKGSLYMRSDGSSTATRMYINTDGSTTWTNVVTAA